MFDCFQRNRAHHSESAEVSPFVPFNFRSSSSFIDSLSASKNIMSSSSCNRPPPISIIDLGTRRAEGSVPEETGAADADAGLDERAEALGEDCTTDDVEGVVRDDALRRLNRRGRSLDPFSRDLLEELPELVVDKNAEA